MKQTRIVITASSPSEILTFRSGLCREPGPGDPPATNADMRLPTVIIHLTRCAAKRSA